MKMQNSHSSEQQLEQPCSTLLSFLISPKQSTSWYQYVIHYEYVFIHYICDIIQGQCCIFNFNGGGTKAERILSVPLIWGTKSPIWAPNLGYICYHEGNLIVIEKCYSWHTKGKNTFSLTTLKFPDFSRFSRLVATLTNVFTQKKPCLKLDSDV